MGLLLHSEHKTTTACSNSTDLFTLELEDHNLFSDAIYTEISLLKTNP